MKGGIQAWGESARIPFGADQAFDSLRDVVQGPVLRKPRPSRTFVCRPRDLKVRSRRRGFSEEVSVDGKRGRGDTDCRSVGQLVTSDTRV